jgi:diguanylate cyclase (GGDEF)-like protein
MAISTEQIVTTLKRKKPMDRNSNKTITTAQILTGLISKLQKTLVLEDLLTVFSKELSAEVKHNGFLFEQNEMSLYVSGGTSKSHSCEYSLSIDRIELGKITFMRKSRFTESELTVIESRIGALLYPLRNALLYRQAIQSAHTDPLTGVLNRSTLLNVFQKETALTKRHHSSLSLLMLDIDFFKKVNDSYGHAAGDEALKTLTNCMHETVRESDPIFRLGGEEFAILLNDTDIDGAKLLAERLRHAVETSSITHEKQQFNMTVSIGLTELKENEALDCIMQRADIALYSAKESGRNKVVTS